MFQEEKRRCITVAASILYCTVLVQYCYVHARRTVKHKKRLEISSASGELSLLYLSPSPPLLTCTALRETQECKIKRKPSAFSTRMSRSWRQIDSIIWVRALYLFVHSALCSPLSALRSWMSIICRLLEIPRLQEVSSPSVRLEGNVYGVQGKVKKRVSLCLTNCRRVSE